MEVLGQLLQFFDQVNGCLGALIFLLAGIYFTVLFPVLGLYNLDNAKKTFGFEFRIANFHMFGAVGFLLLFILLTIGDAIETTNNFQSKVWFIAIAMFTLGFFLTTFVSLMYMVAGVSRKFGGKASTYSIFTSLFIMLVSTHLVISIYTPRAAKLWEELQTGLTFDAVDMFRMFVCNFLLLLDRSTAIREIGVGACVPVFGAYLISLFVLMNKPMWKEFISDTKASVQPS